ncbi:MAG: SpoIVB peptidase S55 domain-containing protein [Myxococcota bacterium]
MASRSHSRGTPGWVAAALLGLGLTTTGLLASSPRASARGTSTISVDEVKPGMRGHAVTVFFGETSDRFEIEVVDVMRNYLPKQDAVLFRSSDPRLEHSGIVGGMSGSPIFLDGKMVGALSYGWRFNKDPLGALTPIGNMLEVGELPFRPDVIPRPSGPRGHARSGSKAWADQMLGLDTDPRPARRRPNELEGGLSLSPLPLPLTVAGFGSATSRMLGETFGMIPVRGGSGPAGTGRKGSRAKDAPAKPKAWKPGDSVSVVLIRGDSSAASNGTVTWVGPKGERLLAFGHSMFEDGPSNLPMANARVHTIINSVDRSVKMSSPLTIQGLMYQDRQPAIALRTDLRAPMIPVTTTMVGPDPDLPARTYHNEVAFGVDLTPNLVAGILAEAVDEAGRDAAEVVIALHHEISLETSRGPRTLKIDEEVFFPQGLIGRVLGRSRGIVAIMAALDNQFEVAQIRGIEHEVRMHYGAPVETIDEVRLLDSEIREGDVVRLSVTLRAFKGDTRELVVPVRIPDDAGGEQIKVMLTGGEGSMPYRPLPDSLDTLLQTVEQTYPSRSLVVTVYRQGEGLATRHGLIEDMPDSVLESLMDRGSTTQAVRFKRMARRVLPSKTIIDGLHTLRLDVLPRKTFDDAP